MELNSLYTAPAHEEGAEVQINDPVTGEPTDFYIKVKGVDSKAFREEQRKVQRALIKALKSSEEMETDEYAILVASSIGWRGLTNDGKDVEFSKDAVRAMYENSPNIAQQVDAFILNRANFTKG